MYVARHRLTKQPRLAAQHFRSIKSFQEFALLKRQTPIVIPSADGKQVFKATFKSSYNCDASESPHFPLKPGTQSFLTVMLSILAEYDNKKLVAGILLALLSSIVANMWFSSKKMQVQGKHIYITGASQGLGLAAACQYAARGAHITIVARRQPQLDAAVKEVKSYCKTGAQKVNSVSADLSQAQSAEAAFTKAIELCDGVTPHMVICAAGMAGGLLGLFAEDMVPEQFEKAMGVNYFTAAYTAMVAARRMVADKVQGKIVFVSSTVGFIGFAGYSAYAPAKAAVRSLADVLRNELLPHNISVHLYAPGNMLTPGFELENETKPKITKVIEGADEGCSAEHAAQCLMKGLDKEQFFIFSDPISSFFAAATSGASPRSGFFRDGLERFVGWIAFPIWRRIMDHQSRTTEK